MSNLATARWNPSAGLSGLTVFMVYGFVLIYLRDFAPGAEQWAAKYSIGKHFVVAHPSVSERTRRGIAALSLVGLLMPFGILAEILLSASPIFALLGGLSVLLSFTWAGFASLKGALAR